MFYDSQTTTDAKAHNLSVRLANVQEEIRQLESRGTPPPKQLVELKEKARLLQEEIDTVLDE